MTAPADPRLAAHATLDDFERRTLSFLDVGRTVHVSGSGPAVVVMHEMPGIGPHVLRFARWVREAGFTVWLPSLFGVDLATPSADEGAMVFRRACVSAEFRALGGGASSPVTAWLRALARHAHQECGGPGVGAIGMCFTGHFALATMLEPAVLAPVLAQPALPLDDPAGIEMAPGELAAVRVRLERDDLTALGYRFAGDRFCRAERFAAYARALGPRFVARVLPDDAAQLADAPPFHAAHVNFPHSVVTVHLADRPGEPTLAARDEILDFFRRRLRDDGRAATPAAEGSP